MSSKFSRIKKQQDNRITKSDARFYKMSGFFFVLCAIVLFIVKIMDTAGVRISTGFNMANELYNLFRNPVYIAVLALLLVLSLIWVIISKTKKIDESRKIVTSLNVFVMLLYVVGFSFYYGISFRTSASESIFVLAATVVLGLIYYISKVYQKDFLAYSIENAVFVVLLYRYFDVVGTKGIVGKALLIVAALLIGVVLARKLSVADVKKQSNKKSKIFVFSYFVSLVIWSVFMLLSNFSVTVSSGFLLTAMLVQYIVFAIIYTIKLIRE